MQWAEESLFRGSHLRLVTQRKEGSFHGTWVSYLLNLGDRNPDDDVQR